MGELEYKDLKQQFVSFIAKRNVIGALNLLYNVNVTMRVKKAIVSDFVIHNKNITQIDPGTKATLIKRNQYFTGEMIKLSCEGFTGIKTSVSKVNENLPHIRTLVLHISPNDIKPYEQNKLNFLTNFFLETYQISDYKFQEY